MIGIKMIILMTLCLGFVECILRINVSLGQNEDAIKDFVLKHMNLRPLTIIFVDSDQKHESFFDCGVQLRIIEDVNNIPDLLVDENGDYIINGNTLMDFDLILSKFRESTKWRSTSRFLFIFQNNLTESSIAELFERLWRVHIYNAVSTDKKSFYTWFPYADINDCGKKFHLTKYTPTSSSDPFSNKIPNKLSNCQFNLAVDYYPVFFNRETNDGYIPAYINLIGEKLNMSSNIVPINFLEFIEETGTTELVSETMKRDDIQGCISDVISGKKMACGSCDYSYEMTFSQILILVPPRTRFSPDTLAIFPQNVLLAYASTAAAFIIAWKYINNSQWLNSMLDIIELLLTVQSTRRFIGASAGFLVILMLCFALIMNTVYSTGLSSMFTSPELSPKIRTVEQFLDSPYFIKSTQKLLGYAEMRFPEDKLRVRRKFAEINSYADYYMHIDNYMKDPVNAIGLSSHTLLQIRQFEEMEILTEDPIARTTSHILLKRNYPLLRKIDYWILTIREAGLPIKWLYEYSKNMKKYEMSAELESVRKLDMIDMLNSFKVFMIGLTISFCVFLAELLYYKSIQI